MTRTAVTRPATASWLRLAGYGGQLAGWDAGKWMTPTILAVIAAFFVYASLDLVTAAITAAAVPLVYRTLFIQTDSGRARTELRACLRDLPSWQSPSTTAASNAILLEHEGQKMYTITLRYLYLLPGFKLEWLVIQEWDAEQVTGMSAKELADVAGRQYELRPFQPGVSFGVRDAVLNMALPEDVRHKRFAAQWNAGQRPAAYADTEQVRGLCERLGRAERIPA